MMMFGLLGLLFLVGAVILVGGLLRRSPDRGLFKNEAARTARQVLDERLARGEIDLDEYETLRAALEW